MKATTPIPSEIDLERIVADRYVVAGSGCWEFTGSIDANGRPRASVNGRQFYAYRIAYTAWVGPIPDGMQINHHCDNPVCINPAHLYPGTAAENLADAIGRGRHRAPEARAGEAAHNAALTAAQVVDIATRYADRAATQQQLADEYDVSTQVISGVVLGRSYPDVVRPVTNRGVGHHLTRKPCGTRAGWYTHKREGTTACDECREANRAYMAAYKANRRLVTA